jgi:type II secretory pathway component PulK
MKGRDSGFALLAALWALVLVGAAAGTYLGESRHFARISFNRSAEIRARHAALAGIERAHNALERLQVGASGPAALRAWNRLDSVLAGAAGECLDHACYQIEARGLAGEGRVNVNTAPAQELARLPGIEPAAVEAILEARRRGVVFAELVDVLKVVPKHAHNALLDRFAELLLVTTVEPDEVEVTSRGAGREGGPRVAIRAVFARQPQRLVPVKRWRFRE